MDNLKFFHLLNCHFVTPESPGTTLCGEYKETLKTLGGTRKSSEVKTRPEGVKLCVKCEHAWKSRKDSAWSKWVQAV